MAPPSWAFLLDENMPKRAANALRMAGYSAVRVIEVGLRAKKDPVIFAYACACGHKTAVKCLSHGSGTERWKTGFLHISSISLQKIQIGRINLQKVEEIINEKTGSLDVYCERMY